MNTADLSQFGENDINLYATHINVAPLFVLLFIIGVGIMFLLLKRHRLRKVNILLSIISVFTTIIGISDYDTFLKDIYRGGFEVNLATVSGVCAIISLLVNAIILFQLLRKDSVKQK